MGLLKSLLVPTNPDFDWDADPNSQPEYVNPVTLNNKEVEYANAAIHIAQKLVATNKEIARVKRALIAARHAQDDFEREVLLSFPAPPSATKSTKLLQAYLYKVTTENKQRKKMDELTKEVRELERELIGLEIQADTAHDVFQAIKLGGEHIQTHLSFVKSERSASGKYT